MSRAPSVLVVGGGITGLAAAWEAAHRGAQVCLVEAGPRFGGKIRTEQVDGLLIEHGPDSFVAFRPAALDLIDALGMSEEVIGVRGHRVVQLRVGGRLQPMPEGMSMVLPTRVRPFATTPILSWRHKARAGLDLVMPRRLGPDDTSIGTFLRTRLGDGVVERIAEPLVGGIYGAGVDALSLDAVLPSLRENERDHRSLMLASLAQGRTARRQARTRPSGAAAPGSPFRSLRAGMGSLTDRLESALPTMGADLVPSTAVVSMQRSGGRTAATLSDGSRLHCDAVILAVGATAMAGLLSQHAPEAAAALRAIPQGTSTIVTLAVPADGFPQPPTSQGWLEAGGAPISGVTLSSVKWSGRAPDHLVLLRAFVPERLGPLARQPDAQVVAAATDHVREVLGFRGEPVLTRVSRWVDVMPTYTVGHLNRVAVVESALAGLPGWFAAGSALHGAGIPECIADGRRTGQAASAID